MTNFISQRKRIDIVEYGHQYRWKDSPGSGYNFPCDATGAILADEMSEVAYESLAACHRAVAEGRMDDLGTTRYEHAYYEPATIACDRCGEVVELRGFTNTCPTCGADYSLSGQLPAPREQWGEETGETASDILMGGCE